MVTPLHTHLLEDQTNGYVPHTQTYPLQLNGSRAGKFPWNQYSSKGQMALVVFGVRFSLKPNSRLPTASDSII